MYLELWTTHSPPSPWISLFWGTRGIPWWIPGEAARGHEFRLKGVGWGRLRPLPARTLPALPARSSPGTPTFMAMTRLQSPVVLDDWTWARQHRCYVCSWDPRGLSLSHNPQLPPQSLCASKAFCGLKREKQGLPGGSFSGWRWAGLEERGGPHLTPAFCLPGKV